MSVVVMSETTTAVCERLYDRRLTSQLLHDDAARDAGGAKRAAAGPGPRVTDDSADQPPPLSDGGCTGLSSRSWAKSSGNQRRVGSTPQSSTIDGSVLRLPLKITANDGL